MSTATGRTAICLMGLLFSQVALAQRVVVLEFDGDKKGKLRNQVESALKKSGQVEIVSIKKWKEAAAKKKLRGEQAMTPKGVKTLAKSLQVDAAIEGAVSGTFLVRIIDPTGNSIWQKDLPLKNGLVSAKHAFKLAKAIAVAAAPDGKAAPAEEKPEEGEEETATEEEKPKPVETETTAEEKPLPKVTQEEEQPARTQEEKEKQLELAEAHTYVAPPPAEERDSDLDAERAKKSKGAGPKMVVLALSGTTTWRTYCSRPGSINSCAEYDTLEDPKPRGDYLNFVPIVPYAGVALSVEFFPMAGFDSAAKGIGIMGSYGRGFSLTKVREGDAEADAKPVISVDQTYSGQLAYRQFISLGKGDEMWMYLGGRGGIGSRSFEVDENAPIRLPGAHRFYPQLGADAGLHLSRFVQLELGGSFLLNPKPTPEEVAPYGDPSAPDGGAVGRGLMLEAGVTGELWGPFGYMVRFRMLNFTDKFTGPGLSWAQCDETHCGGIAQEWYTSFNWGLTASF